MEPYVLKSLMALTALLPWVIVVVGYVFYQHVMTSSAGELAVRVVLPIAWLASVFLAYLCWGYYAETHPLWFDDHQARTDESGSIMLVTSLVVSTVISGLCVVGTVIDD